jgi:hypothetical protein
MVGNHVAVVGELLFADAANAIPPAGKLAAEAARHGDAGGRPQVVWPNGALASTAVGLAVDLVTGWTRKNRSYA